MSTGSFCGEAGPVLVAESRRSGAARRRHEGAPGHRPACLRLREPLVVSRRYRNSFVKRVPELDTCPSA
jgi:hypothetical protein